MASTTTNPSVRKVNFSSLGKAIPAGIYSGVFDSFKFQHSKPSERNPNGLDGYSLIYKVTNDLDYTGRKIYRWYSCEGDGVFYFFEALTVLGADPEELADDSDPEGVDIEAIMRSLYGAHCLMHVVVGSFNGRETNNIDSIESI